MPSEKQIRIINYANQSLHKKAVNVNLDHFQIWNNFKSSIELHQQDARLFNANFVGRFNTVIQSGLVGRFSSEEEVQNTAEHFYKYLKPNGVTIWINWTRNTKSTGNPLYSGGEMATKLTKEMYSEILKGASFKIEQIYETQNIRPISIERGHRSVLWAIGRK